MTFPIIAYIEAALELARYDKPGDGSFTSEIPKLKGVVAFGRLAGMVAVLIGNTGDGRNRLQLSNSTCNLSSGA